MICTLPFDINKLKTDEELHIDMSRIDWKFFKTTRNVFIFLRNLDLPYDKLHLDFSTCDYFMKEKFLLDYIESDIELVLDDLDQTLIQCIKIVSGKNVNEKLQTIFNLQDTVIFSDKLKQQLIEVISLLKNAIYYAATVFSNGNQHNAAEYDGTYNVFNCLKYCKYAEFEIICNENCKNYTFSNKLVSKFDLKNMPFFIMTAFAYHILSST